MPQQPKLKTRTTNRTESFAASQFAESRPCLRARNYHDAIPQIKYSQTEDAEPACLAFRSANDYAGRKVDLFFWFIFAHEGSLEVLFVVHQGAHCVWLAVRNAPRQTDVALSLCIGAFSSELSSQVDRKDSCAAHLLGNCCSYSHCYHHICGCHPTGTHHP